ncbi:hypothetical protein [Polyangium jinanense]|uniref:Terpene synthase n=1 Tax=Polyangium jinanense TaxID=2829994 RepID=A0A9X3XDJ5_9BACT|nr:hypothetical protein [Polyangium jinanense]MDC3962094.1 hypothetical protein [Polyangium jinanense]MDC3988377.1 hypothetical protein [Polyangium jinanense]
MQSPRWFEVKCQPPWRPARKESRRIILLPDGNHRKGESGRDYTAGAAKVVACAEHVALRGDVGTLLVCIASRQNVDKRPEAFFDVVAAQFEWLRSEIQERRALIQCGIRCTVRGNLARMRTSGGSRARLVASIEAACEATRSLPDPRMDLEFWIDYPDELAWERDVDLVLRTGAEEPDVVRPGFCLPPCVPCVATTTLWPDARPEELGDLIDRGLRDASAHFAPGYELDFVFELVQALPRSRIPAPLRLTIPVCASAEEIDARLQALHADPTKDPAVEVSRLDSRGMRDHERALVDDAWYGIRMVPAARFSDCTAEDYDAVLAPGQAAQNVLLAAPVTAAAPVHPCPPNAEGILHALRRAVRFPVAHVLLQGADRSRGPTISVESPWPAELLDLIEVTAATPERSIEQIVRARLPRDADADAERDQLVLAMSARVLGEALSEGLLLPDRSMRQGDRNYAYTGAYMMLRVPDEADPTGEGWERSAELAIRCMLAISAGDNGIFDRVLPGETPHAWRARLQSSADYLEAIARGERPAAPPVGRGMRIVDAVGKQWESLFSRHAGASSALAQACRDALVRHYRANALERAPDVVDNPLVRRLGLGGPPRKEAIEQLEARYASRAPGPVGERIRFLLREDASNPARFTELRRELRLLLHVVDTAPTIAVEILFLFCGLATPAEHVHEPRLRSLIEVGQLADHTFRLANDLASLSANGGDRDASKESCLSILIPKGVSASTCAEAREHARALGEKYLAWLEEQLGHAMARLAPAWPSMAEKMTRAVHVGRGVYRCAHYTTLSSERMLALIGEMSRAPTRLDPPDSTISARGSSASTMNTLLPRTGTG